MSILAVGNQTLNMSTIETIGQTYSAVDTVLAGAFSIMFFGAMFFIFFMRTRRSGMATALTSSSLVMVVVTFYFYLQNYIPFTYPFLWAGILGIGVTLLFSEGQR